MKLASNSRKYAVRLIQLLHCMHFPSSIDDTQLAVFEDIQLKRMFNCAVLFIEWLQGGLYDFSSLPDSVFKHMNSEDQEFIQRIPNQYPCMFAFYIA